MNKEKTQEIIKEFNKRFDKKWGWNFPEGLSIKEIQGFKMMIPSSKEVKEFCKKILKDILKNNE